MDKQLDYYKFGFEFYKAKSQLLQEENDDIRSKLERSGSFYCVKHQVVSSL